MDFDRSITLRVRDRTRAALSRINRRLRSSERVTRAQERATQNVTRATSLWSRAVQRVGTAFDRVRARASAFFRSFRQGIAGSIRSVARLSARLAAVGAVGLAGAVGVADRVTGGIASNTRRANAANEDRAVFDRLLRYLQIASDRQLDGAEAGELVAEFRNRLGEARIEGGGATFDALGALGKLINDSSFRDNVLSQESVAVQLGTVIDALSELNRRGIDTQFLTEEVFGGTEGRIVNEISTLSADRLREIQKILDETQTPITAEDVENVDSFRLSMSRLRGTLQRALDTVILPALPAIEGTVNSISDTIQKFIDGDGSDRVSEILSSISTSISDAVADMDLSSIDLEALVPKISTAITDIINSLTRLAERAAPIIDFLSGGKGPVISQNGEINPKIDTSELERTLKQREAKLAELEGLNGAQRLFLRGTGNDIPREIELLEAEIRQIRERIQAINSGSEPEGIDPSRSGARPDPIDPRRSEAASRAIDNIIQSRAQSEAALMNQTNNAAVTMTTLAANSTALAQAMTSAIARLNAARPAPQSNGSGDTADLGQEVLT